MPLAQTKTGEEIPARFVRRLEMQSLELAVRSVVHLARHQHKGV